MGQKEWNVERSENGLNAGAWRIWREASPRGFAPQFRNMPRRLAGPPRRSPRAAASTCPQLGETAASQSPVAGLWIKQIGASVVGMIRLADAGPGAARIDTFRVHPDWYRTAVVDDLIRSVEDHCRKHHRYRVLVDFRVAPPWMPSALRRCGFRVLWHDKTWEAILTA